MRHIYLPSFNTHTHNTQHTTHNTHGRGGPPLTTGLITIVGHILPCVSVGDQQDLHGGRCTQTERDNSHLLRRTCILIYWVKKKKLKMSCTKLDGKHDTIKTEDVDYIQPASFFEGCN